ncbi:Xaa-Pro aminopeptidase 1 [Roseimaritima multifibrata]|uniref:Xaa-Pro aminopeptidase 1 n=1 Tax=Roseimaritima multifibrata TaxID=1930274 RepID=A0A517MEB1_9BACT|nr:M24 family metallopeptidase [Roseimaritima multifibrata]QDS93221.1 Xaa-Pro aminopeptidase 1 [Roseimaritima multifibrata]
MPKNLLLAGIPAENPTLFRVVGITAGDPAAWISIDGETTLIIRDIEAERARLTGKCQIVHSPADFTPAGGLDADRATATAQAVAEFLVREGVKEITVDRSLPFLFAWQLMERDIRIEYDADLGVLERRVKSLHEIDNLRNAQKVTEEGIRYLCELIAHCEVDSEDQLMHAGEILTSEKARALAARFFLDRNFSMGHGAIVATAPEVADCHHSGTGPLRSGVPIIVDLYPRDDSTRYWGDCTRTVVHGTPSDTVLAMHAAVCEAKAAGIAMLSPGNTAAEVHQAVIEVQQRHGFKLSRGKVSDEPTIQHGTGHGIGLEVHEPILLDDGGGRLLEREVFTVEPGLYGRRDGAVRLEDMVVVAADGPLNLNHLPTGLDWT